MFPLSQLEQWTRVVYFCQYCGYEFSDRPRLPTKCPQCGRTLREFDKPVIDVVRPTRRQHNKTATANNPDAKKPGKTRRLWVKLWPGRSQKK